MADAELTLDNMAWRRMLGGLEKQPSRANELLRAVFNVYGFADINDHFRNEEGPDGKWPKRSPVTQAIYEAIQSGKRKPPPGYARGSFSPSNKLLQLTGLMRQSLLPNGVKDAGRGSIRIIANTPYSGKHQDGDSTRRLPKRPFMWLSDGALGKMAQMIVELWNKI